MVKNTTENHYGEENIQVLEGLEPVRKRPGMYTGNSFTTSFTLLENGICS